MSSALNDPLAQALAQGAAHLYAGKYFQLAAFVMLIYDHILTFPEEVERIWKQKLSGASVLFLINRYLTPIDFIIVLDAFHDPHWTKKAYEYDDDFIYININANCSCAKFVAFEGAATIALVGVCQLILILRIYALFGKSRYILGFLGCLWITQISLSSIGISFGYAAPLPPGFVGCIFAGSQILFPAVWITPLVTDICIFILTVWRTRCYITSSRNIPRTIHLFVRDGLAYFVVIFMANLLNTLIFFVGPPDLKAIGASFSQLITSVMISRLVLNLRSLSLTSQETPDSKITGHHFVSIASRTVQELGADMDNEPEYPNDIPLFQPRKRASMHK